MDSDLWDLEVAGDRRPLHEWGIRNPVLRRVNAGLDEFSFFVPKGDIFTGPPFAFDAAATLWRGDVRYFSGQFMDCIAGGSGEGEGWACRLVGPWQALEDIIYQQPYVIKSEDFLALIAGMSTRVVLGQDAWGKKISIDQQIRNIGNYALSQGAGLFTIGALDAMHGAPLSEARDISCAAAIRRMMDIIPDSVAWFDYSSATPVLRVQRRSVLTTVSVAADTGAIVRRIAGLRPRNDLKARGVVFIFQTTEEDAAEGRSYTRETRQTAGATSGRRVIFATIALGNQGTAQAEAIPANLATEYYAAVSELHYSGEITLKEEDCTGTVRPGHKLNLSGGVAAWATMAAVVQQTAENLETGETEVTLGPPEHLGAQDFVDLQRYWRERPPLSDFAQVQHNGSEGIADGATEPGINGIGGGDPDVPPAERESNPDAGRPPTSAQPSKPSGPPVSIPYCEGGVQTSVVVYKAG